MTKAREITFNRQQEEYLIGTLLGDAFIVAPNKYGRVHAALHIEHSTKQQMWAEYKAGILGLSYYTRDRFDERTEKTYHSIYCYSESSPTYTALHATIYRDGHKTLDRDLLEKAGPLALATWFLDDGHTEYNQRRCKLHTERYTLAEQQVIQQWFIEKWGLHPTISEKPSNGTMKYILIFDVIDSYRLLEIIRPFVTTPDMMYKVTVKPYTESREPKWHKEVKTSA